MMLLNLPEELILRICSHLHRLDDLYAVILSCKTLFRISDDVSPRAISRMALDTGNLLPGLRPCDHFLMTASAHRLPAWVNGSKERLESFTAALQGGMSGLTSFTLSAVPITLDDIRQTWRWKNDIVNPLSKRLHLTCGRRFDDPLTVCEDPELALFQWAIYGELFGHALYPAEPAPVAVFDSVTRFKFLVYCIPDVNSFQTMDLDPPGWFEQLDPTGPEAFQQLSLREAMRADLSEDSFHQAIEDITERHLMTNDHDSNLRSEDALYVKTVMSSGKKSLEVLRYAMADGTTSEQDLAPVKKWLLELRALQYHVVGAAGPYVDYVERLNAGDPWLKPHAHSLRCDTEYTMWESPVYDVAGGWQHDPYGAGERLRQAVGA